MGTKWSARLMEVRLASTRSFNDPPNRSIFQTKDGVTLLHSLTPAEGVSSLPAQARSESKARVTSKTVAAGVGDWFLGLPLVLSRRFLRSRQEFLNLFDRIFDFPIEHHLTEFRR
jgi:hypothetical protein